MESNFEGFDPERFKSDMFQEFVCPICTLVAFQPKECMNCGALICTQCLNDWVSKKNECPRCRHDFRQKSFQNISKALQKIYYNLDVQCKYYDQCQKTLKLLDLAAHEALCQQPKCYNYSFCQRNCSKDLQEKGVCDMACLILATIRKTNGNWPKALEETKELISEFQPKLSQQISNGTTTFKWDRQNMGAGIELSNNNTSIFLKESAYMFRTILGDQAFYNGIHYWEILADSRTENELKIGVSLKKEFNLNSAFADYDFGYSYYGLGQLRHGSNAAGKQYGKRFKKEGTLEVFLDMNRGILAFGMNGEYWGVAFQGPELKKGPIYPAISVLHCAGCRLINNKATPAYFFN